MDALGEAYRELARYDDAERLHREALEARRRVDAPPPLVASSLNNLALTMDERGRPAEAEPLLREAIGLWRRHDGEASENVAVGLNNLAAVLRHQGRLLDAVPLLEQSIAIRRQRAGDGHPALAPASENGEAPSSSPGERAFPAPQAASGTSRANGQRFHIRDLRGVRTATSVP